MPGVFPLNDFSQLNAHGRLPWDLLTASHSPPPLAITPPPPGSSQHPKNWPPPPWLDVDVVPHLCTRLRTFSFPVHVPWANCPWQRRTGKSAAPPFLGTKKQLICVSETECLEGPFFYVCGSLSAKPQTQRVKVHCYLVIAVMCRMHVKLK